MPLRDEIAALYRPAKWISESFIHPVHGECQLSKLRLRQVQDMEKEGHFILIKRRKKS